MNCCIDEICSKDVIDIENGNRIGSVYDVEVDMCSGQISTLLVSRREQGIAFRKPECLRIHWSDIVVMGEETILVKNVPCENCTVRGNKRIFDIFSK